MDFKSLLPQSVGWLANWQLFVAATAAFNTIQNFSTLNLTRRLYSGSSETVTPLQARTFAIWTLTSATVRFYAAYNINEKIIYDLALFTYLFAFGHFVSETFIFRTAKLNIPVLSPIIVASASLLWMITQYDFYVKS